MSTVFGTGPNYAHSDALRLLFSRHRHWLLAPDPLTHLAQAADGLRRKASALSVDGLQPGSDCSQALDVGIAHLCRVEVQVSQLRERQEVAKPGPLHVAVTEPHLPGFRKLVAELLDDRLRQVSATQEIDRQGSRNENHA